MLLEVASPVTQTAQAVIELLSCLGKCTDPLPDKVELTGGAQLTRSNKGDVYYYTSPRGCSCPGYTYRHNCKHVKALIGQSLKPRGQTITDTLEEHDKNLYKMPVNYQKMVRAAREDAAAEPLELLSKKPFKPVLE